MREPPELYQTLNAFIEGEPCDQELLRSEVKDIVAHLALTVVVLDAVEEFSAYVMDKIMNKAIDARSLDPITMMGLKKRSYAVIDKKKPLMDFMEEMMNRNEPKT